MDQKYLNEYLASVNGDSSLTNDSNALIQKHITGLFAFAQQRQVNENKPVQNSAPEGKPYQDVLRRINFIHQPNAPFKQDLV